MTDLQEHEAVAISPEVVKLLSQIESDSSFLATNGVAHAIHSADMEQATLQGLSEPIMLSPALTERVLRLANAASLRRGEPVTTVNKAVALLGFYSVKSIALMLAMLDEVNDESLRTLMLQETAQSTAAMTLARELAHLSSNDSQRAGVQAVLCALGRVIVVSKMPQTYLDIKNEARALSMPENEVARRKLGMGYYDIAARGAAIWRLGDDLCRFLSKPESRVEGSALAALTADKVVGLLSAGTGLQSESVTTALSEYARRTQHSTERVQSAIETGLDEFARLSRTLGFPESIAQQLVQGAIQEPAPRVDKDGAVEILSGLTSEVTRRAARDASTSSIVTHVLEQLVKKSGFQRGLFLVRDREGRGWTTRYACGANENALLRSMHLPVTEPLHLLSAALERNTGLTINDVRIDRVRSVLPAWFDSRLTQCGCFVLLPIAVRGRTVAALYLDRAQANALPEAQEMEALMALRDALTLALRAA